METPPSLRPATAEEIGQTLAHALRFDGRKRVHTGDEHMAQITADRLVRYLQMAGFVVMKRPAVTGSRPDGKKYISDD